MNSREDHTAQGSKEAPEPSQQAQDRAADMMTAYEDRPTLVLPGSGGMITGTAVNDWLDESGDPKSDGEGSKTAEAKRRVARDKELNEAILKTAGDETAASG